MKEYDYVEMDNLVNHLHPVQLHQFSYGLEEETKTKTKAIIAALSKSD